jgi:hypothetical protein
MKNMNTKTDFDTNNILQISNLQQVGVAKFSGNNFPSRKLSGWKVVLGIATYPPSVFLPFFNTFKVSKTWKVYALGFFTFLLSFFYSEKTQAQACGSCATANCTGIKQYADKTATLAGVGKVWKNYSPALTNATGNFTVYATIITDANGQVSVMQEVQIQGSSTGLSAQSAAVVGTRTYSLYALSDVNCTTAILPANILNDGCSSTFNPAWTNLQPNTSYKLALKTNLGAMAAGYTYVGFNIRFYNNVRPLSSFAFNCGSAAAVGTFYANGVGGQAGTLTVPIASATSGTANFTVTGAGFSGSAAVNIATVQTSVSIPLNFDGSGVAGTRTLTVTSAQGTGTCSPVVSVKPLIATFAFNCGTASSTGSFIANNIGGQTGSLSIPLSNATAGQAVFNVSGGGFSGSLTTTLTAGQASVSIPITYSGSGSAGNHAVSITSAQGTGGCGLNINVISQAGGFTFNCATASVIGRFVANGTTNQNGFLTIPITGAIAGNTVFTVSGTGFSGTLTTTLTNNQTQVNIPITYDGSGASGTRPLSISATTGGGACVINVNIVNPAPNGAINFNCPTTASIIGNFIANGTGNQTGLLNVNFTTQTAGEISFTISGGGFTGSISTNVSAGQTGVNMLVIYDGMGVAGNHAITVSSSQATGSCGMNVPVQALFAFNCGVFNTSSNFLANGQSQTGSLVIPLSNTTSGSATFTLSGGGFTGSVTTVLRDSQRFVAIPVTYDGSGTASSHAATVISTQGSGSCAIGVKVKDPAADGCDFIKGQNISLLLHSENKSSGFATQYILVDAGGIIQYQTAVMPFTNIEKGTYEAYVVNYTGTPAPTLTTGTALNAIGGSCVSLSNALSIKVCAGFQFSCGTSGYDGVFIANGVAGQTGVFHVNILNAIPTTTTVSVNSGGFVGSKTQTLTLGQTVFDVPVTYDGTGNGGVVQVMIAGVNAFGTCSIGVTLLPNHPTTPFVFNCNSAVLNTNFIANGATQSGSVQVNIATISADATTNFTVSATNFGGGLTNAVLSAGQTSIAVPIEYNGAKPHGTFAVTLASPHASNNCLINVPVGIDCTVQLGVLTRN